MFIDVLGNNKKCFKYFSLEYLHWEDQRYLICVVLKYIVISKKIIKKISKWLKLMISTLTFENFKR